MTPRAWLRRLAEQLPGWHVWVSTPGMPHRWNAAPVAPDVVLSEATHHPDRVSAPTPQALRELCQARYGWFDFCQTCDCPAHQCGHRMPEGAR